MSESKFCAVINLNSHYYFVLERKDQIEIWQAPLVQFSHYINSQCTKTLTIVRNRVYQIVVPFTKANFYWKVFLSDDCKELIKIEIKKAISQLHDSQPSTPGTGPIDTLKHSSWELASSSEVE